MFGLPIPSLTAIKLAVAGIALLGALGGGFYAGYRWELGAYEQRVASDALAVQKVQAAAMTLTRTIDAHNTTAAVKDAQVQQQIVTKTVTLTREVPVYVHDKIACPSGVTVGFIRVLVAAERGVDPASLSLPAGVTDDTCAADAQSDLAAQIVADFGAANANAQQLNDLIAAVKANDATATAPK